MGYYSYGRKEIRGAKLEFDKINEGIMVKNFLPLLKPNMRETLVISKNKKLLKM